MKFYCFHLMPYSKLELNAAKKYNSAWITLPNSYYDPKHGPELYNRYIDELVLADKLGFDGVGVNEHHQTAYGMMPIPGVIAGALARETKRAKIMVMGRALPLLNNPLTVAEEYAMLDNISGGRLIAGFVRGIGAEYHAWSANPTESHGRFHEAHDLIIRAWTETGPFAHHGKYYNFEYVNTWPRPVQQPHPPVWIPSQGSQETIEWTAHPDRKYPYLQTFSPAEVVARYHNAYREQCEKYGYTATGDQLGWAVPIYVAETDEIAYREAKPHIEAFRNRFVKMPLEMLLPPGYTSRDSLKRMIKAKEQMFADTTIDIVMKMGMFICGSPSTVVDLMTDYQKQIGFNILVVLPQFGTLPADLTDKNMRLFASEVMPKLRPLGEATKRGKVAAE